jgi:serine/threonine protein kinase
MEKTNLERIATLKDPHLVQIQKTYQLGDKFNILFPCANTNLHDYLRNVKWYAPQNARINKNPLWEQVLGITKALNKIINFTDPLDLNRKLFGYHLDLKPQNILIDNSATGSRDAFKITDFGQAKFLDPVFAGTSRIHGAGGTDAYAPPEYQQPQQDRVYDVWSLGIIVLEVLAFAIRGVDGLLHRDNGLDHVRFTKEGGHANSRFYTTAGSRPIVKPRILKWIDILAKDPMIQDIESRQFVQNLCDLILKMLEPQMNQRIAIDAVLAKMGEIFQMDASQVIEVTAESLRERDEITLVDLKYVLRVPMQEGRRTNIFKKSRLLPWWCAGAVNASSIYNPGEQ